MMTNIKTLIQEQIKNHDVVLYMKGTPDYPQCGFSEKAVAILNHCQVEFITFNVLSPLDIRTDLKQLSKWPTFPQLYVKGELIGGYDIMLAQYNEGSLQKMFTAI